MSTTFINKNGEKVSAMPVTKWIASPHCRLLAPPGCVAASLRAQGSRPVQLHLRQGEQQVLQSAFVLLSDFSKFVQVPWRAIRVNLLESPLALHVRRFLIIVSSAPLTSEKTFVICALRVEIALHFVTQVGRLSVVVKMAHCGEPTETLRTRHTRHYMI